MAPTIKCFTYPMKLEEITGQRILTSTRESDENSLNTELFVKNVPTDADEEELIPFFEQVGPLQTLRLMMNEKKTENRGYVYITYLRNKDTKVAISILNGKEIRKFKAISVELSLNNCRIFVGGIPVNKSKDQVWQELIKQGVQDIVDVIMYRSYNNRAENRGFVFVEFPSHKLAAKMRCRHKDLMLWGNKVIVDWSVPQPDISDDVMAQVKIIYLRNLSVMEPREDLKKIIERYIDPSAIEKLYKFKNYAFVHLSTRELAEKLLKNLENYYRNTHVEVSLAKPPNNYTHPEYRRCQMSKTNITTAKQSTSPDICAVPSKNVNIPPTTENHKSAINFCGPIFTIANPYSMNSFHHPHYTSVVPLIRDNCAGMYHIGPGSLANYYDFNSMRNQNLIEPRSEGLAPASYEYFRYADPFVQQRSRNRHDSAVSDLTECCPSDVLRDYNQMLEEALGTTKYFRV